MQSTIPVIDISPFVAGDPDGSREVAAAVDRAARDVGFFVVVGHDVPPALVDRAHAAARAFFDLDVATKDRYQPPPGGFAGYRGLGAEGLSYSLDNPSSGDLKETFTVSRVDRDDDPYYTSQLGRIYVPDNLWPAEVPEMRASWTDLYRALDRVAAQLMRIFAAALDLAPDFFDRTIDRHITALRALNYPPQLEPPLPDQLRAGAHSDYGSLTLLSMQDAPGGLEVHRDGDVWERVAVSPHAFVANLGDLMAQWTNDTWRSALHRVGNPPREHSGGARRQSLAFFHQPNYDAEVVPLASRCGPDRPPRYAPTTSGEHLYMKLTKAKNRNV
jgi:isopenicillin N synthase-like dioxygenase